MRLLLTLALVTPLWGQGPHVYPGGSNTSDIPMMKWFAGVPSGTCYSQFAINSNNGSIYTCPTTQAWVCVGGPDCAIPSGVNVLITTSGNCAATNIAAGTGSTTACKGTAPNLTVTAQTFTGSALAGHTHTLTATGTNGTAAFTPAGTNGTASFTPSGTVAWPAGVPTNATASFTPAGTNGTVSFTPAGTIGAPTFSGNSFDNRSAYVLGIFCTKQ